MSFTDQYIEEKTKCYTLEAVAAGKVVTSEEYYANEGEGVVADCDLDTPSSFVEDMMATWTLDLGLTEGREAEIRNIVVRVVSENIPKEMRDCL